MAESSSDRNVVEVLAEEFVERYRNGERPPLSEYTQRYPEHAEEIEDLFPALLMMENLKPAEEDEQEQPAKQPALKEIGDYRILGEVGRGGMGIVYEAEQLSLGRRVAVKVLPQQMLLDPKHKRRFEREARAAARLHHTNIVPVFGVGEQDGMHYYVMQFIQGLGLDEVLEELRRMKANSQAGNTVTQGELSVGRRSDQFSAVNVARSLMTGQFEQTVVSHGQGDEVEPSRLGSTIGFDPDGADADLDVRQSGAGVLEKTMASSGLAGSHSETVSSSLSGSLSLSGSMTLSSQSDGSISSSSARARRKQTFFTSVANMGRQVASALQYAHEQGITHRDIKPSNLLLDMQGTVWVTDFGLAKANDQQDITHTGDILGTLRYMPPEAFEGGSDARGDQYSLGLTLYELLAQKPAFDESDRHKLIKLVTTTEPTRIDKLNRDIPRDLATIVHKAIDRDPAHRYASSGELAADLERFLEDEPIKARRPSVAERLGRWSRRNRGLAAALSVISALVLLIAIGSTLAAGHFQRVAGENADLAERNQLYAEEQTEFAKQMQSLAADKEEQRLSAETARADAEVAKTEIERQAAELKRQQERAEGNLYSARIALAENHLNSADGVNAQRSLFVAIPDLGETDRRGWEWYYLTRWSDSAERTFVGHSRPFVYAVAFSPDGRLLASAGGGNIYYGNPGQPTIPGEVLIRDFATGRVLHTLTGHKNVVTAIGFSADGRLLATAGLDLKIIFWDVDSGRRVFEFDSDHNFRRIQFAPDGKTLLVGHWQGEVLYSAIDGEQLRTFGGSAVFNHDGSEVYFVEPGGVTIQRLDLESRETTDLVRTPDIAWATCQLAHSAGGRYLGALNGPEGQAQGQFMIWDLQTGEFLHRLANPGGATSLTFSADEEYVAVSGDSPVVRVFEVASAQLTATLLGHEAPVTATAFSPDSQWLAAAGMDGTVRIFPSGQDSRGQRIFTEHDQMPALAFMDDGAAIRVATWGADQPISTWDVKTGIRLLQVSAGVNGQPLWPRSDFAFSPDARRLAAPRDGDRATVTIWDAETGAELLSLAEHPGSVSAVEFSGDGKLMATACFNPGLNLSGSEVRVWDALTGALIRTIDVGLVRVLRIAFSPDSESLATGGSDGITANVSIWELKTGEAKHHFIGPERVYGLSFSPDGRRLAVADYGRYEVSVWDAEQGDLIQQIPGIAAASDVAWSPDGTRLAAIGYEANVHLFDGETLEELIVLRSLGPPTGTLGFTPRVAFSPDGSKIVGNSPHKILTVWDAGPAFANRELEVLVTRSITHMRDDEYEEAMQTARQAIALRIGNDEAQQLRLIAMLILAASHAASDDAVGTNEEEMASLAIRLLKDDQDAMLPTARLLVNYWTSRKMWREAADAQQMIVELAPDQSDAWLRAAPVTILAGDRAAYERQCRRVVEQFQDSESMRDVRVLLKVCLLLPGVVPVEDLAVAKVEEQLSVGEPDRVTLAWEYTTLALAAWRSGDAAGTLRWSQLSLEAPNARPMAQALGLVLQAMAQHELGETTGARDSLKQASELIDPALQEIQPDTLPNGWHDWLIADILRQEAEELLDQTLECGDLSPP